ncbi:GMC oxidoreductase [Shinella zoogloeoides]|uniref:GMC oxidoreductase n=1 Tax=Shinella zoogloeoides TaxID=352475 RepID=UPI002921657F|nr:GMC oxidoreductase [Shinella zoogloeoides]
MKALSVRKLALGEERLSDADFEAHARANAKTVYHPAGTCRMGRDQLSVVDNWPRVQGIPRLRIADASIMSTLVSGNTDATCITIAER